MTLTPLAALGSTYENINGGIHRRTASIVGIPSLIRHVGLWDVSDDPDPTRRPKAFTDYLTKLRAVLEGGANGIVHVDDRKKDLPARMEPETVRSGTIRIARFWWHGMRATIRLEFRTEYVMMTSILDLSVTPSEKYTLPADPANPQRRVDAAFQWLGKVFNRSQVETPGTGGPARGAKPNRPTAREKSAAAAKQEEYFKTACFLQYELWKTFEETVLDAKWKKGTILGNEFGQVFADFRGIVTGSTAAWQPVAGSSPPTRTMKQRWRTHFELQPHGERNRQLEHGSPPHGWARDTLRRLWPLIEPDAYLHEYEFTVSGFLAGRALFVTALGPKLPGKIKCGWEWTPVCNFIHSYTDDVWQLGRLVDRIKNLGTLRLAATVQIERLIDAGARLDELTAAMQAAEQAIQHEINRRTAQLKPAKALKEAVAKGATQAGEAAAKAAPPLSPDLAMDAVRSKRKEIDELVSNDIVYRLERSEYYIDQFTQGAAALRVRRIEGFQKYDEMVARRMSSVFSYIRLMKNRLVDVDARMSALSRAYTSLKAVETTKDIQGLVFSMEGLVKSMENQDKQIEKIQEFGEIALIGFLIPYYLGATLFHYALHLEDGEATAWWLGTIMLFAWIVAIRSIFRMEREGFRSTAGTTLVFSVLYMLIVMALLGPHLPSAH